MKRTKVETFSIRTNPGEPMTAERAAKDLETIAHKIRSAGASVEFSLSVCWPEGVMIARLVAKAAP